MSVDWHVDPALWARYTGGALEPLVEAALEKHVTGCAHCRGMAAQITAADQDPWQPVHLESQWQAVHLEIARPRLPRPLRWAVRRGLPEGEANLLVTSRDLVLSSTVALGAAVACAILVGLLGARPPLTPDLAFLLLAPLVPFLSVVAACEATEGMRELTQTTPYSALRLALLRAAAALTAAIPTTVLVGTLVPGVGPATAGWLLPGLMLSMAGLVALTWTTVRVAAPLLALTWTTGALIAARADALALLLEPLSQLVTVAILFALLAVLLHRTSIPTALPGVQP